MGRANTPLEARNSPLKAGKVTGNKNSLLRSVLKPPRSPVNARQPRSPFKFKPLRQSPYNRPLLAPKNKLSTIREESPDSEVEINPRAANISAEKRPRRHIDFEQFSDDSGDESSDLDTDFEGWDDETTLVAKFQDSIPEATEREKLASLAYELEAPMQARGDLLKQYLAHTIAPAARRVKEVHRLLEQKVDVAFGVGVISFDDACKMVEQISLHDEEDLKNTYVDTQRNVREMFKQLKEAYEKREQLWSDLREAVDKSAARTLTSLTSLPAELDEMIAVVEKKAKDLSKSGGMDGKAKQKLLRDLLAEI